MNATIEVKLSLAPSSSAQDPNIQFEVSSSAPHRFCIWHTPLEGIAADMLEVVRRPGDERAPYLGAMLKRGAPEPEDFQTVEPDKSTSVSFRLGEAYDIAKTGRYSVQFKGNASINGLPDSNVLELDIP